MSNIFTTADALSSAAVNRFYGERLRFLPRRSGNYTIAESSDPSRSMKDFIGTLTGTLGQQNISGDRSADFQTGITTRDRTVTCDYTALPADLRPGDHIQALDQKGQPTFQVAQDPMDDGSGNRVLIALVTI